MTESDYEIRNYRLGYFNQYFQFRLETERMDQAGAQISRARLEEELNRPNFQPGKNLFLAEIDGRIVGAAGIFPELPIGRVVLEVIVRPDFRRQGLAKRLVSTVLDRSAELGTVRVQGEAAEVNLAAQGLLKGLGFKPVRPHLEMVLDLTAAVLPDNDVEIVCRPLESGQERKLTRLQNRSFSGSWGFNPNTTAEVVYDLDQEGCSFEDAILAWRGGRLCGYCWLKIAPAVNALQVKSQGRVQMLGVDPDHRNRGIGLAVLIAGLARLKEKGIGQAILTVDGRNRAALSLYRSAGFEARSRIIWYEKRLS
ncbi:MAG: GNAT family N-acetyltransferase [Deltaproteobacteria bacterium]|nr:GNAT family N-acetyltransferase [Deltaproteobacteria bacterium]